MIFRSILWDMSEQQPSRYAARATIRSYTLHSRPLLQGSSVGVLAGDGETI
jgi:hypothetical protein